MVSKNKAALGAVLALVDEFRARPLNPNMSFTKSGITNNIYIWKRADVQAR